jgi:membrane fusion protein, multidrug efflux system
VLSHGDSSPRFVLLLMVFAAGLAGCAPPGLPEMVFPPPAVTVSYPLERDVTDYNDFTGRTAAVEAVKVRARVWGYLQKINFREGAEVKKDDVLFEIDPRTYQADLDRAEANLVQSQAHRDRLQADYDRGRRLLTQRAIGQEEYDKIVGDRSEAEAAVRLAEAGLAAARLNLDFTKVRAPVAGHISRTMVTVGNLVQSGETGGTTLTNIVSVDPVYVYFDVDDLTFVRINHLTREEKVSTAADTRPAVLLGLAHEQGYPRQGVIDFVDNQVDPGTGTLKMRGLFRNGDRALTPGLFARVRVPFGSCRRALLVTDRAVDTDQGQKVVYVADKDDVVEKRAVRLGRLHDGLREIETGLSPGERVVVDGIQRVRGGIKVEPKLVDMPALPEVRPVPAAPAPPKATVDAGRAAKS